MSVNNFIKIDRKNFTVSDCDADTNFGRKIGQGKNLDEAIDIAIKYQEENIVEYGIQFTDSGRGPLRSEASQNDIEKI